MATCKGCGSDHEAGDLVRHERGSTVIVHCPDCDCRMGTWRDPSLRRR